MRSRANPSIAPTAATAAAVAFVADELSDARVSESKNPRRFAEMQTARLLLTLVLMMIRHQATRIELRNFSTPPMRAFHMAWSAFSIAFFSWFAIAPLMPVVRDDLVLGKAQIANTMIASVAITFFARLVIGPLCDRFGPRRVFAALLAIGAVPVACIGLANDYQSFLLFRLAIGAVGASFVVTQVHTSIMFAPTIVGTANAAAAGWGNLGGGIAQVVMPLLFSAAVALGAESGTAWRLAMIVPGLAMAAMAIAYYRTTTDAPDGDFAELRARGELPAPKRGGLFAPFREGAHDVRSWVLFVAYGACFGVELTVNNFAALYFVDRFHVGLALAGCLAGLHGLMNVFARALGGIVSDRLDARVGLDGRVALLFAVLLLEGIALVAFAKAGTLAMAIPLLLAFSLFVQMGCGATYGIVPFVNRSAMGSVAGIVGAGGNAGAVLAGFLFRADGMSGADAFLTLGIVVLLASPLVLAVRFPATAGRRAARAEAEPATALAPA